MENKPYHEQFPAWPPTNWQKKTDIMQVQKQMQPHISTHLTPSGVKKLNELISNETSPETILEYLKPLKSKITQEKERIRQLIEDNPELPSLLDNSNRDRICRYKSIKELSTKLEDKTPLSLVTGIFLDLDDLEVFIEEFTRGLLPNLQIIKLSEDFININLNGSETSTMRSFLSLRDAKAITQIDTLNLFNLRNFACIDILLFENDNLSNLKELYLPFNTTREYIESLVESGLTENLERLAIHHESHALSDEDFQWLKDNPNLNNILQIK